MGRRYGKAISAFRQALDLQPDTRIASWFLSLSYQANSQPAEALATLASVSGSTRRSPIHLSFWGYALGCARRKDEVEGILTELRLRAEDEYVAPFLFAFIHLGIGGLEAALDHLEQTYEEQSPGVVLLQRPEWDPLRDHPRFQDLRRRVGLPQLSAPRL